MIAVALADAKARLSELVDLVEKGEAVSITRRGKPVARLVAEQAPRKPIDLAEMERVRNLSKPWDGQGSFVVWCKEQDLL